MANQEEFLLKWNDHHNSFFNIVQDLCAAELLTDVTLACSGQVFETHKIVLCASSAFFRSVLAKQRPDRHPIVFLKDVDPKHLEQLLHYMYQGEITVLHEDLNPLIETARALQVKGLADAPSSSAGGGSSGKAVKRPAPAAAAAASDHQQENKLNQAPASGQQPPLPPLKKARNPLLNSVKGNLNNKAVVPPTSSHLANRLLQPKNPQQNHPLVQQPQLPLPLPLQPTTTASANANAAAMPFMALLPTVPEPPALRETDPRSWKIDGEDVGDYDNPDDDDDVDDRFNDEENYGISPNCNDISNKSSGVGSSASMNAAAAAAHAVAVAAAAAAAASSVPINRRRYPCLECGKAFVTPSKLQRHTYSHSGIRPFVCNVCSKSFSQSANLKTHVKNTHPESLDAFGMPTPESMTNTILMTGSVHSMVRSSSAASMSSTAKSLHHFHDTDSSDAPTNMAEVDDEDADTGEYEEDEGGDHITIKTESYTTASTAADNNGDGGDTTTHDDDSSNNDE